MTDLVRVRTIFTGVAGTPWYSNLYFMGAGVAINVANCHAQVAAFWNAYKPNVTTAVSYTVEGDVPTIDDATGNITGVTSVTPVTAACTGVGDSLPYQTQGLIRLYTNTFISGRRLRGRVFLVAPLESLSTTALPTAAYVSSMNAAATTMKGAPGAQLAVYSRTHHTSAAVQTVSTWSQWAVQRSRRD